MKTAQNMSGSPLRILVIPSWYPPRGGNFFQDHNEALLERGHIVHVLVNEVIDFKKIGLDTLRKCFRKLKADENGLLVYRTWYLKYPKLERANIYRWARKTFRFFTYYIQQEGNPDIIYVHCSAFAGLVAHYIQRKYGIPYVILENRSRFVANNPYAKPFLKSFHIPPVKKALSTASKVLTVSKSLQPSLISIEPLIEQKVATVPNCVNVDKFFPPESNPATNQFRFFSLGAINHVKGIDILLDAYRIVCEKTEADTLLTVGGTGNLESFAREQAKKYHLKDRILFTGKLNREGVQEQMQKAHAFVHACRVEAFGVVLIEAMASGLPVIATRCGGPESILAEFSGTLVPIDDPEALAEGMLGMIRNYSAFDKNKIREYALKNYSKQRVAELNEKYLLEVVNG